MAEEQVRGFLDQAAQSIQNGMFNQAIDLIEQVVSLDPSNAEAYLLKGVALANVNQPDGATEAFRKAIELQPGNSKAHFNLAVHLSRSGDKAGALAEAREALNVDPSHAGARELIGQLEREMGVATESVIKEDAPPVQATAQNPYQNQNPYAQSNAPYYREGYAPAAHTLPWVENMGQNWVTIGWTLAIISLVLFILSFVISGGAMMEAFQNPTAAQQRDPMEAFTGWRLILTLFNLAIRVCGLLWVIFDIIDRRGNWAWLVLYVLCCCCIGPGHAIYMAAGRKQ